MSLRRFFEVAKDAPKRHPLDVFAQLSEEVGELATEINIQTGFRSDRQPGPDGILGEACDGIICLLDEIYLSQEWESGWQFEVVVEETLRKKVGKWRTKFQKDEEN